MAEDLRGFLLNCFIGGETGTVQADDRWVRNRIDLSFAGRDITVMQEPWVITARASEYRDKQVPTTTVVVPNVRVEEREVVLELLQGLSYLLSFATCSNVALYGWDHPGSKPSGSRWRVVARMGYTRPVFDIRSGKTMRLYLERVWQEYFRLEQARQLRAAIDLFVLAETRSLPLELQLATMFILLENLKSTFADEKGYPFAKGRYRKASGEAWAFEGLLSEMFNGVGMASPNLSAMVELRNEIIHSGISQTPLDHQREIYGDCQDLVREYFLRLLGYSGKFRLYSGRGMTTKEI